RHLAWGEPPERCARIAGVFSGSPAARENSQRRNHHRRTGRAGAELGDRYRIGVHMTPQENQLYQDWLALRRPLLEAKQWTEAMRDVPRLLGLELARPRPLARPLSESSVALVTSAGISQAGQPPMDGDNIEGDYTLRLLDIDTPVSELRIWHTQDR